MFVPPILTPWMLLNPNLGEYTKIPAPEPGEETTEEYTQPLSEFNLTPEEVQPGVNPLPGLLRSLSEYLSRSFDPRQLLTPPATAPATTPQASMATMMGDPKIRERFVGSPAMIPRPGTSLTPANIGAMIQPQNPSPSGVPMNFGAMLGGEGTLPPQPTPTQVAPQPQPAPQAQAPTDTSWLNAFAQQEPDWASQYANIISKAFPSWESLTPPQKPQGLKDFLTNIMRGTTMAMGGINPLLEKQEQAANIEKRRQYESTRAGTIAQAQMKVLDFQRDQFNKKQDQNLKMLELMSPEVREKGGWWEAVGANLGLSPEATKKFVSANTDPATGKVKLYTSTAEREQNNLLSKVNMLKTYIKGMDDETAIIMATTGNAPEYFNDYRKGIARDLAQARRVGDTKKVAALTNELSSFEDEFKNTFGRGIKAKVEWMVENKPWLMKAYGGEEAWRKKLAAVIDETISPLHVKEEGKGGTTLKDEVEIRSKLQTMEESKERIKTMKESRPSVHAQILTSLGVPKESMAGKLEEIANSIKKVERGKDINEMDLENVNLWKRGVQNQMIKTNPKSKIIPSFIQQGGLMNIKEIQVLTDALANNIDIETTVGALLAIRGTPGTPAKGATVPSNVR